MFCTYIVGRYRPPGNFQGKFQENVVKGSFNKDICNKLDDMIKDAMNAPSGFLLPPPGSENAGEQDNGSIGETQYSNDETGETVSDWRGRNRGRYGGRNRGGRNGGRNRGGRYGNRNRGGRYGGKNSGGNRGRYSGGGGNSGQGSSGGSGKFLLEIYDGIRLSPY